MAMSNCTRTLLADGSRGPASYLMAAGRVTDVDRRPAIGDRQPGIHCRPRCHQLTVANAGPYIRDNRTRTHPTMRSRNPTTARPLLTFAAVAWVNFGLILDANNEYVRAESAYRKSLDIDSANAVTRLYLGENLLAQKKYAEARNVFGELVKLQDNPLHRKRLGDAYAGEKNFAEAINQYRAALKLDSNYYPALNEIGAA